MRLTMICLLGSTALFAAACSSQDNEAADVSNVTTNDEGGGQPPDGAMTVDPLESSALRATSGSCTPPSPSARPGPTNPIWRPQPSAAPVCLRRSRSKANPARRRRIATSRPALRPRPGPAIAWAPTSFGHAGRNLLGQAFGQAELPQARAPGQSFDPGDGYGGGLCLRRRDFARLEPADRLGHPRLPQRPVRRPAAALRHRQRQVHSPRRPDSGPCPKGEDPGRAETPRDLRSYRPARAVTELALSTPGSCHAPARRGQPPPSARGFARRGPKRAPFPVTFGTLSQAPEHKRSLCRRERAGRPTGRLSRTRSTSRNSLP